MKKTLTLIMAVLMLATATACIKIVVDPGQFQTENKPAEQPTAKVKYEEPKAAEEPKTAVTVKPTVTAKPAVTVKPVEQPAVTQPEDVSKTTVTNSYPRMNGEEITDANRLRKYDVVTFGVYEQDGNTSNGKEPIEWLVLKVSGTKVLMITKKVIENRPFHNKHKNIRWRECDLRTWLNDNFLNTAFSKEEQKFILEETHRDIGNEFYGIDIGIDSKERVFILDSYDAGKFFDYKPDRIAEPTEYMKKVGKLNMIGDYCWWWLRNPGQSTDHAMLINPHGAVFREGDLVTMSDYGVRPAIWIDLP